MGQMTDKTILVAMSQDPEYLLGFEIAPFFPELVNQETMG
jgi:hypothetical protein